MRRLVSTTFLCWLAASVVPVWAQAPAKPADQTKPADPAKPADQTKPAEPEAAAATETSRSLFDEAWNQFQFGGRWTSVDGDEARFQRYQDMRSGLLFNGGRFLHDAETWSFKGGADNVGWRDQRYFGRYERPGVIVVSGLWDQVPQFYSIDTRTPYTSGGEGVLVLDDATQRAIQNGAANLNAWVPLAPQFDLRERRDIGAFSTRITPESNVDVRAAFTTTKHSGELPWGGSFGFGNDVEVALPYNSRTNDLSVGAEWTSNRAMFRVGYNGSWFDNIDDTLIWDSPLRLDDSTSAPGRGRMALWPSNSAQTVSGAGYVKLARRTQVTGFLSYGVWSNDQPLLPFTINAALPQLTLPRATTDAAAHVLSTNLNLVSRPVDDWRMSARFRRYDYNNETPGSAITQFINYDTSVATSATGGPELLAHDRTTFDADATYTGLVPLALTVGYTHNGAGYHERIFESTGENVLSLKADAAGWQWVTFRAQYDLADRSGSGLDEALLVQIGEQPKLRHYDLADRQRNRLSGQVDLAPNETWTVSFSAGFGKDEFDDSYFGLQESSFRTITAAVDTNLRGGFVAGGSYSYERYTGLQRSRSASPGQETDPLRDWTTDSKEKVHYFALYLKPPRIGPNTEMRLSYDYGHSRGDFVYTVVPGGPLPAPSQLPEVFNKLQNFRFDLRHRLSNRLAATVSYLYEPFDVFDFAFSPDVIDSIVQPSSLILGSVYRPYTAHSAVFGILSTLGSSCYESAISTRKEPAMSRPLGIMSLGAVVLLTVAIAVPSRVAVAAQDEAQVKKGAEVYTAQKCQICHAIAGKGNKANPLDGVGKKLSADDIRMWITHPVDMAAKAKSTKKPPMAASYGKLPAADLDALVAYLQSLK